MKMKMQIILGLGCAVVSQGAIVVSSSYQLAGSAANANGVFSHTYSPSSTDLIQGQLPSSSVGVFTTEFVQGLSALTDGSFAGIDRLNFQRSPTRPVGTLQGSYTPHGVGNFATAGNTAGTQLTYSFANAVSIESIDVYSGWQDKGRIDQHYKIYYTTTSNSTFVELAGGQYGTGVSYNLSGRSDVDGSIPIAAKVSIYDDSNQFLLENVTAIRFDFLTTANGYTGYAEIDIIGIPEPSSLALLSLGLLVVGRRKRR